MENDYQKQAEDFLIKASANITIELAPNQKAPLWAKDGQNYGLMYNITIHRTNCKDYSFNFWNSITAKAENRKPTDYDILACLTKYDPGFFEDFCSEYGYNEDSRTAERTFLAVIKEWKETSRMFGDLLEELQEIN